MRLTIAMTILIGMLAGCSTNVKAGTSIAYVWHVEKVNRVTTQYISERRCNLQQVPIYQNQTVHGGSSNGDLLGAMIFGGILGKALGDTDQAAAAGAVLGALAQNNNGVQTQRVITGYEQRNVCNNVNVPTQVSKSTYIIHWKSGHRRGSFYSDSKYVVGDSVYVRN